MASHPWVAEQLLTDFKANPSMSAVTMQKLIMERFGVAVPKHTCHRARKVLRSLVDGKHEESYARLVEYIEEIKESNPGTIASCIYEGPNNAPLFKRIFISFGAMITGFTRGCRPFIGVDGCFLKGPYKGVLLTAMGLDANNGYFPLAYGVVEKENKDNWGYFFKALRVCLQDTDLSKYTFISDRHKVCIFFSHICLLFLPCFS